MPARWNSRWKLVAGGGLCRGSFRSEKRIMHGMDLCRPERASWLRFLGVCLLLAGLGRPAVADCSLTSTGATPMPDLGGGLYRGFAGGLYPNGAGMPPAGHLAAALARGAQILPLDPQGHSDAVGGHIAMLSV